MKPFTVLTGVAAPIDQPNVDTDQIIPARFLKKSRNDPDYHRYMFHDKRFDDQGHEKDGFVLHQDAYRNSKILVANRNFACGSSREAAVYALMANNIRCVIAPSFGDIFFSNSFKNGNLPIIVTEDIASDLRRQLRQNPSAEMTIDLSSQSITAPNGNAISFDIDPGRKQRLLDGLDDIALTLKYEMILRRMRPAVPKNVLGRPRLNKCLQVSFIFEETNRLLHGVHRVLEVFIRMHT